MSKKRLLIVEDNERIADLVSLAAREAGYEVQVIGDIRTFPAIYDQFLPHVIALDIMMPEMDGFEVLHFLHDRTSQARILILSGQASFRLMAERMATGLQLMVVATLAKPFRVPVLRGMLEELRDMLPEQAHVAA